MSRLNIFYSSCVLLLLAGCSVGSLHNINETTAVATVESLHDGSTGVLVYRAATVEGAGAVNVYLDHDYFASLQNNGYRYIELCPGTHTISLAYTGHDPAYAEKQRDEYSFTLGRGETSYLKVGGDWQQPRVETVSEEEVAGILNTLRLQDNTLSRVVSRRCVR